MMDESTWLFYSIYYILMPIYNVYSIYVCMFCIYGYIEKELLFLKIVSYMYYFTTVYTHNIYIIKIHNIIYI